MTEPMIEVQPGLVVFPPRKLIFIGDADPSTEQHYPTHVGFDELGNELLVNLGGKMFYLKMKCFDQVEQYMYLISKILKNIRKILGMPLKR